MKYLAYVIGNRRVMDIVPIDAWNNIGYSDMVNIYNPTGDFNFYIDWVLTFHNNWEPTLKSKIALVP